MGALGELWALRSKRPWTVGVALGVLAFLLVFPAIYWWLRSIGVAGAFAYYDLGTYRWAVRHWQMGEPIYVRNPDGGFHQSYLYPPIYLLLFVPLTHLPFRTAGLLVNVVSVATLWGGLQALIATYEIELTWPERGLLLWALLGFHPVLFSMRLAQVSIFLAGIFAFALAALRSAEARTGWSRRVAQTVAGVLTAFAGGFKLVYAPVGAHLLQNRRRFAAAIVTGLGLLALSLAIFGLETHRAYIAVLQWGKGWGTSRPPHLWLPGYFRPLYVLGPIPGMVVRVGLALVISTAAVLAREAGVDGETFALGLVAIPLIAPRVDTQALVLYLPAVVVLLAAELRRQDGYPVVPLVGLWLAAVHSYGLYVVVEVLPPRLPAPLDVLLIHMGGLLQPGLWAAVLLVGVGLRHVGEAAMGPDG